MLNELLEYIGFVDARVAANQSFDDFWHYLDKQYPVNAADRQLTFGNTVINGVALPQLVIDQLRQHGYNPEWCSRYELEAAERGAAVDCEVFNEPDGDNFFDDLELTDGEIEEKEEAEEINHRSRLCVQPNEDHEPDHKGGRIIMSFEEQEKRRRKEKLARTAEPNLDMSA